LELEHEKKNQQFSPKMEPHTKNSRKKLVEKKGTVEFGKIFGYDIGKTVDTYLLHIVTFVQLTPFLDQVR
jgi:hypothetical protein